ncbi:hypothetical protein PGSY75_0602600 [Plasmodium gaboni]|uniref:SAC3/GANP/THP3 conserved domain-containing protein n=1 Tax=Plasmodium gaboni TaxID=647221 RepID=A0A151LRE7_9APIC|nr:hypothetical protein PGSY75_0602600 [Plasmodium gaboni]KYO01719.1 hypothetical protein PGSY75_0602600 [Plasmodium gaboni]
MNEKNKDGQDEKNNNKENTSMNVKNGNNIYQNKNEMNNYIYNNNINISGNTNSGYLNYHGIYNNNNSNNMNHFNNMNDINNNRYYVSNKGSVVSTYQNNTSYYHNNKSDSYYKSVNYNTDNINYMNMYNNKSNINSSSINNVNSSSSHIKDENGKSSSISNNDLSYYINNNNDSYVELYINKVKEIYYFHVFYHYIKLGFPEKEAAIESKKYIFITLSRYFLLVKNAILSSPESIKQINNCVSSNLIYYQQKTNLQEFLLQQQSGLQNVNTQKINIYEQMNLSNLNIANLNIPLNDSGELVDLSKVKTDDLKSRENIKDNNMNISNNNSNNSNNGNFPRHINNNTFNSNINPSSILTDNIQNEKQNNNYYNIKPEKINDMIDSIEEMKKLNSNKKERKTFSDFPPQQLMQNKNDSKENMNDDPKKKISFTLNKSKNKIFQTYNRYLNNKNNKSISDAVSEVSDLSDDNKNEKGKEKVMNNFANDLSNQNNINNINHIGNMNNYRNDYNNMHMNNTQNNKDDINNNDIIMNYRESINNHLNVNNKYNYNNKQNNNNMDNNVNNSMENNTYGLYKYTKEDNMSRNSMNNIGGIFSMNYGNNNNNNNNIYDGNISNSNNTGDVYDNKKFFHMKNNYIDEGNMMKYRKNDQDDMSNCYPYDNNKYKEKNNKLGEEDLEYNSDNYDKDDYSDEDDNYLYNNKDMDNRNKQNNNKMSKLSDIPFFTNNNDSNVKCDNLKTYIKNLNDHFKEQCNKNKEFAKCLRNFISKIYTLKRKKIIRSPFWLNNVMPTEEDVMGMDIYFFSHQKRTKRRMGNSIDLDSDMIAGILSDKKMKLSQEEIEKRERRREKCFDLNRNKKNNLIENSFYIDTNGECVERGNEDLRNLERLMDKYNFASCYKNKDFVGECRNIQKFFFRLTSLPERKNVRSFSVLKCTYAYILYKYNMDKNYKYINEQFRSLRQDLNIQNIFHDDVVNIYETNIRICIVNNDLFQFLQCINKLFELYQRLNITKSKVEFLCYKLIYMTLQNMHQEFLIEYLALSDEEKNHENIQLCYYLNECIKNKMYLININMVSPLDDEQNHEYIYYRIFVNNHILQYLPILMSLNENVDLNVNMDSLTSFVKSHGEMNNLENIEKDKCNIENSNQIRMPYLTNYLIVLFLPKYRLLALINICKTSIKVNISTLTKLLNFENDEKCLTFLNEVNTIISNNEVLSKSSLVNLMKSPLLKNKYINHIR